MKRNKDISKLFRDSASELQEQPTHAAWRRLEQRLDQRRSRSHRHFKGMLGSAAAVLLLLGLVFIISLTADYKLRPGLTSEQRFEQLLPEDASPEAERVVQYTRQRKNRGIDIEEGAPEQQLVVRD